MKTKQELDFVPTGDQCYYYVDDAGCPEPVSYYDISPTSFSQGQMRFHNVYPTKKLAEKAAKLMRRSNAIIRACLLVDPDFEPDWRNWNQEKFGIYCNHLDLGWFFLPQVAAENFNSYVSSSDKAQAAIGLLEKWGVE